MLIVIELSVWRHRSGVFFGVQFRLYVFFYWRLFIMKRALSITMCLMIVLNAFGITPNITAAETEVSQTGASNGITGDCTWKLDDNGTLTISGNGAMEDYYIANQYYAPFMSQSIKKVIIENGVTHIGDGAFSGCKNVERVIIPNSVTSIGENAFQSCSSLIEIAIPNSVTMIGGEAFSYCRKLSNIEISDSVESIGWRAFYDTAWYNSQPDGLIYLDKIVYECKYHNGDDCPENLIIKDGTVLIAGGAFYSCDKLTDIMIPNSIKAIGCYAFSCCTGITEITIPESVTRIDSNAFANCYSLSNITIPESVISIGDYAFSCCENLTSITIPKSVVNIDNNAFSGCKNLTSVTISDSLKSIGNFAFSDCKKLKSVTLPASITNIGSYSFGYYDNSNWYTSVSVEMVKYNDFTIYGYENTEAEKYAKANEITFVSISDNTNPTLSTEPTTPTIPEHTEPTTPTIPEIILLLGDVDGDKAVTIIDATYIQRSLASIPIPFEMDSYVADTDGDGTVTILDATYIQRWLANLKSNELIGTNLISYG